MSAPLNATASLQLTFAEMKVQFDVVTEALKEATVGLAQVAETAVEHGDAEIARQALDVAQSVTEKVHACFSATNANGEENPD